MTAIKTLLIDMYMMWPIYTDMPDVGHSGASRSRVYIIFALRGAFTLLCNPQDLASQIFAAVRELPGTRPRDYLFAPQLDLKLEASEVCRVRKIQFRPNETDFSYMMTDREKAVVEELDQAYLQRFGSAPHLNEDLCYFLGDSPTWAMTWSAISQRVPTFRRNTGKMWFPAFRRWMTSAEKLLALISLKFWFFLRGCPLLANRRYLAIHKTNKVCADGWGTPLTP